MCACSAASIFLFASSKLLPRTVTASSSQTPFQESCSSQKLQSFGTPAITLSFTGWAIADPPFSYSRRIIPLAASLFIVLFRPARSASSPRKLSSAGFNPNENAGQSGASARKSANFFSKPIVLKSRSAIPARRRPSLACERSEIITSGQVSCCSSKHFAECSL